MKRISELYSGHWNRNYVSSKLKTDPLYSALLENIRDSPLPLLDLGCGLGLSALYLRTHGVEVPIHGLDYDQRKIDEAKRVAQASGFRDLSFSFHDARQGIPAHEGNVSILDILQFFTPAEQETLLCEAANCIAPAGKLIIRSGLRDDSWRFKVTVAGDIIAKASFWMKAAPTHYPTADDFRRILAPFGKVAITPLWGGTPFNNHLIVLSRS